MIALHRDYQKFVKLIFFKIPISVLQQSTAVQCLRMRWFSAQLLSMVAITEKIFSAALLLSSVSSLSLGSLNGSIVNTKLTA